MQATGIDRFRWKSVREVTFQYYYRYVSTTLYTVDITLDPIVIPDNCIIIPVFGSGYSHSYNGSVAGKFTIEDHETARLTYYGYMAASGTQGPVDIRARIYESPKAFKSNQFITSQGTSIEIPQKIDWNRALYVRNWFYWSVIPYGACIGIVDANHVAQGNTMAFGSYANADRLICSQIVEF